MEGHLVDWSCMPRKLIKDSTRGCVPDVHKPEKPNMQNYTPVLNLNAHIRLHADIVLPVSGACRYLTAIWWPRAAQKILWTKEIHKTFSTCTSFNNHNGAMCSRSLGQVKIIQWQGEWEARWNTVSTQYRGTDRRSSRQNVTKYF